MKNWVRSKPVWIFFGQYPLSFTIVLQNDLGQLEGVPQKEKKQEIHLASVLNIGRLVLITGSYHVHIAILNTRIYDMHISMSIWVLVTMFPIKLPPRNGTHISSL